MIGALPRRVALATTLGELVLAHGGVADAGAHALQVNRVVSAWDDADARCLVPVLRSSAVASACASSALLLVDATLAGEVPEGRRWVHPQAAWALARVLEPLDEPPCADERGLAHVSPDAVIGVGVRIGAFAVVRHGVVIGDGCVIEPHAVLFPGVTLGARVVVGTGAVVGRPGFGWAHGSDGLRRVPQLGGVVLEDDVSLGAHATVDAGTLSPTRVGRGTKLDAHVHVGHNVVIGEGCLVAAQTGFAGSVTLGRGVLVGGQAGFADHVRVGDGARIAAKAGVIGDVPPGATFAGYPAVERGRWLRGMARLLTRRRTRRDP